MQSIGIAEAKNNFSALIDSVEKGEEVRITRHGKEVVRMLPVRRKPVITDEQIQHVKDLMAGSEEGRIPVGTIVRDDPGVNAPWSWHIDPTTLEFADQTIEVCDGLPEYVEDGTLTSNTYCPWSAVPIKLEGPGA